MEANLANLSQLIEILYICSSWMKVIRFDPSEYSTNRPIPHLTCKAYYSEVLVT